MRKLISRLLTWLLEAIDPKVTSLYFVISDGTSTHEAKHMNTTITDTGHVILIAACVSAAGNPAAGAIISWSSSDESIATVTPAADGQSATVTATGRLGTATITAAAGNLTATDEVTVVAGPAVSVTLSEAASAT